MNALQKWVNFWNHKVKQFTIWDLKYAQMWTAAWTLLVVKMFPQIMRLSMWWFVSFIVLLAPYLAYIVFLRDRGRHAAGGEGTR